MKRDNQRSRVYEWERACVSELARGSFHQPDFSSLDDCIAFADPIWRKERGRVGLARQRAPTIERPAWGQRRALAHADHRITLPRWTRSRWMILHELAHRLTPGDEAHGARFVGVLMGLACRWLDYDANELMALADRHGVKYRVQSIGVVPVHGPSWHVERAIQHEGPMSEMDLACWCDLTYLQVRGAALSLIRQRRARWYRKKLQLVQVASGNAGMAANDRIATPARSG